LLEAAALPVAQDLAGQFAKRPAPMQKETHESANHEENDQVAHISCPLFLFVNPL
jgi:hypothetical protein